MPGHDENIHKLVMLKFKRKRRSSRRKDNITKGSRWIGRKPCNGMSRNIPEDRNLAGGPGSVQNFEDCIWQTFTLWRWGVLLLKCTHLFICALLFLLCTLLFVICALLSLFIFLFVTCTSACLRARQLAREMWKQGEQQTNWMMQWSLYICHR